LPEITWHSQALGCFSILDVIDQITPARQDVRVHRAGADQLAREHASTPRHSNGSFIAMRLREITPAHDDVRVHHHQPHLVDETTFRRNAAQRLALQLPPRRAAQDDFKKATISRAEGGQLQALVRRQPFLWRSNVIFLVLVLSCMTGPCLTS
jgi:hypothetical protein